jgi:hypothetical protein
VCVYVAGTRLRHAKREMVPGSTRRAKHYFRSQHRGVGGSGLFTSLKVYRHRLLVLLVKARWKLGKDYL